VQLAIAAGLFEAAAATLSAALRSAPWARFPDVSSLGALVPVLDAALDPVTGYMTELAVTGTVLLAVDSWTASWTRRRLAPGIALAMTGFVAIGAPTGSHLLGWTLAGLVIAAAIVIAYVTLLRFDLTMLPIALGVMVAVRLVVRAASRAYPGALAGAVLGALLVTALAALWFRLLRPGGSGPVAPAV
jgi:hypothetical protein